MIKWLTANCVTFTPLRNGGSYKICTCESLFCRQLCCYFTNEPLRKIRDSNPDEFPRLFSRQLPHQLGESSIVPDSGYAPDPPVLQTSASTRLACTAYERDTRIELVSNRWKRFVVPIN